MLKKIIKIVAILYKYMAMKMMLIFMPMLNVVKLKYQSMKSFVEKRGNLEDVYIDLIPKEEMKTNKAYIESLDWAILNDNVLNIALSGPYGSGKSSILKNIKRTDLI